MNRQTPQQAAANAKKLAEARVLTAVSSGEIESLKRHLNAVGQVATQAETKVATVMNRMGPTVEMQRRKKRNGKKNGNGNGTKSVLTLSIVALMVYGLLIKVAETAAVTNNPIEPIRRDGIMQLYQLTTRVIKTINESKYQGKADLIPPFAEMMDYLDPIIGDINANRMINGEQIESLKLGIQKIVNEMKRNTLYQNSIKVPIVEREYLRVHELITGRAFEDKPRPTQPQKERTRRDIEEDVEAIMKRTDDRYEEQRKLAKRYYDNFGRSYDDLSKCLNLPLSNDVDETKSTITTKFTGKLSNYEEKDCKEGRTIYYNAYECLISSIMADEVLSKYWDVHGTCTAYEKCKADITANTKLIKMITNTDVTEPSVTYKTCQDELEKVRIMYKRMKLHGHNAEIDIKPHGTDYCKENTNWQADGWLAGDSGSCVTGVETVAWKLRGCSIVSGKCLHKIDYHCNIGFGNVTRKQGSLVTNTHKQIGQLRCCSLMCHKFEEIYESFTNQPLCTSCIKPYTPVFWTDNCLEGYGAEVIVAIRIYRSKTTFEIEDKGKVTCQNAWQFKPCCAGKSPAAYFHPNTFIDKYCVCELEPPTIWQMIIAKYNTLKQQVFVKEHFWVFLAIFVIFTLRRPIGVALFIVYCSWLIVSVEGACSVENLVPIDFTTHIDGTNQLMERVKVRPGQCISAGDATIEIVSIEVFHIYNFLRTIPYFIKPVCQFFDWGCYGGKSNSVWKEISDCYKNCVPGLRKIWKDSEYDWIGDKCFFNGRVPTRMDACFSYGDVNTFVELYTRISGLPNAALTIKYHGIGFEGVGHITTSNLGTDDPIKISEVTTAPMMWPDMISYRSGKYLCAYHYVESAETCNSGDIFKPTDIDPDCLNFQKKWDTEHGGYQLTYAKKDFENQLHNHFITCPSQSQIDNNVTTLRYHESLNWVEFSLTSTAFKFAKLTPMCENLAKWTIKAEPGLTYYHRRTVIKYQNRSPTCKIYVEIDNCVSTNGKLIVLGEVDNEHAIEYWCGGNATGLAHITLANNIVETKELKVLNNFLPHKNTIRNTFDKIVRAGSVGDWGAWFNGLFSNIDFNQLVGSMSFLWNWLWAFSWTQMALGIILLIGAYCCFIRGNLTGCVICIFLTWLLCFTKLVFAYSAVRKDATTEITTIVTNAALEASLKILSFELDFAGLIASIINYVATVCVWLSIIIGDINVLVIEHRIRFWLFSSLILSLMVGGCVFWAFVALITFYSREIYDKITLSGVHNMHYGYTSLLTSWMTLFVTSEQSNDVTEIMDPFSYQDTIVPIRYSRIAHIKNLVKCGKKTVLVFKPEVLACRYALLKSGTATVYFANNYGVISIGTALHCIVDSQSDGLAYKGDIKEILTCAQILNNRKEKYGVGDSGTIVGNKVFIGYDGQTEVWTDELLLTKIDWCIGTESEFDVSNKVKLNVYVTNDEEKGLSQVTGRSVFVYNDGIRCVINMVVDGRIVCGAQIFKDCIDYIETEYGDLMITSSGWQLNKVPLLEVIVPIEHSISTTGDLIKTLKSWSEVNYVDFNGQSYKVTRLGLINKVCNVTHVVGGLGVEVCNDLRLDNRDAPLYAGQQDATCFWTSKFNKQTGVGTKLKLTVVGDCWWPHQNLTDQLVKVRLQHSKVVQCDDDLLSGTLIYLWRGNCFAGDYIAVSAITKSFQYKNKRYYVISRPCDERQQLTISSKQSENAHKWTCAEVTEPSKEITGYMVRQNRDVVNIEFYNKNNNSIVLKQQYFPFFPTVLTDHSPKRGQHKRQSGENHIGVLPTGWFRETNDKRQTMVIKRGESGVRLAGAMHCFNGQEDVTRSLNCRLHKAADYWSDEIPNAEITKLVWIKNELYHVNFRKQLLVVGDDLENYRIAYGPSIYTNRNLVSGTPVYNDNNKFICCITCSDGQGNYVLTNYTTQNYKILKTGPMVVQDKTQHLVYGDQQFQDRRALIDYISTAHPAINGLYVWRKSNGLQISAMVLGREVLNFHLNGVSLAEKQHMTLLDDLGGRAALIGKMRDQFGLQINISEVNDTTRQYISCVTGGDYNRQLQKTMLELFFDNYETIMKVKLFSSSVAVLFVEKLAQILSVDINLRAEIIASELKNIIIECQPLKELIDPIGRSEHEHYPWIIIGQRDEVKPQSRCNIYITHVISQDRDQINIVDNENVIIEGKSEYIRHHLKRRLNVMSTMGARYISVHITGDYYASNDQDWSEYLMPIPQALSCVLWIKVERKATMLSCLSRANIPTIESQLINEFLPISWLTSAHSFKNEDYHDNMTNSVRQWKLIAPNDGCELVEVQVRQGKTQSTLAEVIGYNDRMLVGLLANCLGRGSFFIYKGVLVTNYHCTKGNEVVVTHNHRSFNFGKPTYSDATSDICMYNGRIEFDKLVPGEIVTAFNPFAKFGVHYMVSDNCKTLQGRPGTTFNKMFPIKINPDGTTTVMAMGYERGMSGSPIINSKGIPVGIFGLGMSIIPDIQSGTTTVANFSAVSTTKIEALDFFDMCAKNFVRHKLERGESMYYCNAPTGTGKTTKLPLMIARELMASDELEGKTACPRRILILQPNITAVRQSAKQLSFTAQSLNINVKVSWEVGLQNEDASGTYGDSHFEIMIKTYGKHITNPQYMENCDIIIYDEVHCVHDPNVVAAIIYSETHRIYLSRKILYLSATHLNVKGGYDIAEGQILDSTPKGIEKIVWEEVDSSHEADITPTDVFINKKIISVLPTNATIRIDRRYLIDGLVVFFCATQSDCERGCRWATSKGVRAWAYHKNKKQSVYNEFKDAPCGWVFATDIIQQSVTIPTLRTVVDFGREARPEVRLVKQPLQYLNTLVKRPISLATQIQRRGRVGRTDRGVYISDGRVAPNREFEPYVIPEVALKLLDMGLSLDHAICSNLDVQKAVRDLSWITPGAIEQIESLDEYRRLTNQVAGITNMREKLALTKQIDGDRVKWYIRPFFNSKEEIFYRSCPPKDKIIKGAEQFFAKYKKTTNALSDEAITLLEGAEFMFRSFKDPFDRTHYKQVMEDDLSISDFEQDDKGEDLIEERLVEQNWGYVVAGGVCAAAIFGLIEKLIDNHTNRWISHLGQISIERAPATARYYAQIYKKDKSDIGIAYNLLLSSAKYIQRLGHKGWEKFKEKIWGSPVVSQNDWSGMVDGFMAWATTQITQFEALTALSVGPLLGSFSGGGVLGLIWRELEKACGRPLAMILGITIHSLCSYLLTLPMFTAVAIGHILTTLTRGLISCVTRTGYSTEKLTEPGWSGTIWSALLTTGIGGLVGMCLKQTTVRTAAAIAEEAAITTLMPLRSSVGQIGVPVLLVKNVYYIMKGHKCAGVFANSTNIISLLFESDPLTLAYSVLLGVGIFAGEILVERMIDSYAHRDYGSTKNGQHYDERKQTLRNIIEYMLDSAALLVYPTSIISVIVGTACSLLNGQSWEIALNENFKAYAGVSPLATIITELWNLLANRAPTTEQSCLNFTNIISTIWDTLRSWCTTLANWFKPAFQACTNIIRTAWEKVMSWIRSIWTKCVYGTGEAIGKAAVRAAAEHSWLGRLMFKMDESVAEEINVTYGSSEAIVHKCLIEVIQEGGLSTVDKYWLQIGAGNRKTYGNLWDNELVTELKNRPPTRGKTFLSGRCFEFFKICVIDLNQYVSRIVGTTMVQGDQLKANLKLKGTDVNVSFCNNYTEDELVAIIRVQLVKLNNLSMSWLIHGKREGQHTHFTMIDYGPTDGIRDYALTALCRIMPHLDTSNGIELTIEETVNWHENRLGKVRSTSLLSKLVNATAGSMIQMVASKIQEYAAPPYLLDREVFNQYYKNIDCQYWPYLRYWSLVMPSISFSTAPVREKQYWNPKWCIPYGHQQRWLTRELEAPIDLKGFTQVKYGFKFNLTHQLPWENTFLVTNNHSVTLHTLYMFSLNHEIRVVFDYQDATGQWIRDYSTEGISCGKHWLHVVFKENKWYVMPVDLKCQHMVGVTHLEFQEFVDELKDFLESNKPCIVNDLSFVNQWINEKKVTAFERKEHPTLPLNSGLCNWLRQLTDRYSNMLVPKTSEKIVEQNSRLWDQILNFFGFETDPIPEFTELPNITVLNRINYLLTIEQLGETLPTRLVDEDFDHYYDAELANMVERDYIQGFSEPTARKLDEWAWYDGTPCGTQHISADMVMKEYHLMSSFGIKHKRWESLKRKTRFELPKSVLKCDDSVVVAQSRAFYKMQQIYEADPEFFNNVNKILDPACGYGGFEQYLSLALGRKAPRVALVGTLVEKGHRVPNVDNMTGRNSNFKVVSMIDPSVDNGNIRDPCVIQRYKKYCSEVGGVDMVIYDIGEFYTNSATQFRWWTSREDTLHEKDCLQFDPDNDVNRSDDEFFDSSPKKQKSLLPLVESMRLLQDNLKLGGKMLLKWTGYFKSGDKLLHRLLNRFEKIKAIKLGTSSMFSTEFYILATGYKGKETRQYQYIKNFYDHIGERIYNQLMKAKTIWYNPGSFETYQRNDWAIPLRKGMAYRVDTDNPDRPKGLRYELDVDGNEIVVDWKPNWEERLQRFHKVVRELYGERKGRKLEFVYGKSGNWKQAHQEGWFKRRRQSMNIKRGNNQLLSDLAWEAFRVNDDNSVVGRTQSTEEFAAQSRKKRLDVTAPTLTPDVLSELGTIMELMRSDYGNSIRGKCRILTKEETLTMLNKQGATSVLSQYHSLRDFIEKVPQWYELCIHYCVSRWAEGRATHTFWNIMHKNEPKVKKNTSNGRIVLERGDPTKYSPEELKEELESYNDLPHRFIQYADEISRISHYIVLGDLIDKGSKQKIYKGTINGTPPFHVGNLLRACWDMNVLDPKDKTFRITHNERTKIRDQVGCDMDIHTVSPDFRGSDLYLSNKPDDPAAVMLDFSALDSTVSVGERMLEAQHFASYYPEDMRQMIMTMFKEMCYGICLDQRGDLTLRAGQRGSGEIVTSIGNTLLVAANVYRAVAKAIGMPIRQLLETIGIIRYNLGNYTKILEVTRVPQFSDGDDTVILTSKRVARAIQATIDETMATAGKVLRSGTSSGCEVVDNFWEISFCSHRYERVLVGQNAVYIHINQADYKKVAQEYPNMYRLFHLPTRPTSEIVGKLRATLKQTAQRWNPNDADDPLGSVQLTRSKLISYLLMYPHMRYVRYACLSAIAVTGDGSTELTELIRRYPELKHVIGHTTFIGALRSVYGVESLDDIAFRNYTADQSDAKVLERHTRLIGYRRHINVKTVTMHLFKWMLKYPTLHPEVFAWDTKLNKQLCIYLANNPSLGQSFLARFTKQVDLSHDKKTVIKRSDVHRLIQN